MKDELCRKNIHTHCSNDGGTMGDAITCHKCGYSRYPEYFEGKYVITDTIANFKKGLRE